MDYMEFAKSGGVDTDTVAPHDFEGIKFISRKVISFDEIDIPEPDSSAGKENMARQGDLDGKHVAFLKDSFRAGVKMDLLPPAVVKRAYPIEVNGSIKNYTLLWGNHRMMALEGMVDSWEFDIYEKTGSDFDVSAAQLQENTEHPPALPASHSDIIAWHVKWLDAGYWCDDAGNAIDAEISSSLKRYRVPVGSRQSLVTKIINGSVRHATVKNYVDAEHKRWIEKHMKKENPILSGPDRDTFVMKTGTEHRTLMEVMKHSKKTGRCYQIILNPVVASVNDVKTARQNLIDSINEWWEVVTHFGGKTNRKPFKIWCALPQDITNEDMKTPVWIP